MHSLNQMEVLSWPFISIIRSCSAVDIDICQLFVLLFQLLLTMNVTGITEDVVVQTKKRNSIPEKSIAKPRQKGRHFVLDSDDDNDDDAPAVGVRTITTIFDHLGEDKSLFVEIQNYFVQIVAKKFKADKLLKLKAEFYINRESEQAVDREYYLLCGFKRDPVDDDFVMVL